jgi:hypothetical protein
LAFAGKVSQGYLLAAMYDKWLSYNFVTHCAATAASITLRFRITHLTPFFNTCCFALHKHSTISFFNVAINAATLKTPLLQRYCDPKPVFDLGLWVLIPA